MIGWFCGFVGGVINSFLKLKFNPLLFSLFLIIISILSFSLFLISLHFNCFYVNLSQGWRDLWTCFCWLHIFVVVIDSVLCLYWGNSNLPPFHFHHNHFHHSTSTTTFSFTTTTISPQPLPPQIQPPLPPQTAPPPPPQTVPQTPPPP